IGRVSAPSLTSMRRFMDDEDLWPEGHDPRVRAPGDAAWPPMWQHRSVNGSWDKIGRIERYCDPVSPADLIRVLGTAHGEYLQERVERHRRGVHAGAPVPDSGVSHRRCWGTTVWRLNDPWPIIYWSVVDAYQEPKMPYYFLRRAYDPVLLSFERTPDIIWVWAVNDGPDPVSGKLKVQRAKFTGEVVAETQAEVSLAPGEARRCLETTVLGPVSLRTEFLWAKFETSSGTYQASFLLIGERYLHLPQAHLKAALLGDGAIEIVSDVFARQVSFEMVGVTGAVFEDNYFDLVPSERRRIAVIRRAGEGVIRVGAVNAEPVVLDLAA
ncbi:MAG: glycoside hydrolase family 2 protein, partial [Anaerolineae bacterium]